MPRCGLWVFLGFIALSRCYEPKTSYVYEYETAVYVDERCNTETVSPPVGHKIKANVHISVIWENPQQPAQKLLQIQIQEPQLQVPKKSSFINHASELDKMPANPLFVLWGNGFVEKAWEDPQQPLVWRNLNRGIASLLNLRQAPGEASKDNDVAGDCHAVSEMQGKSIKKQKWDCHHPQFDRTLSQYNSLRSASTPHLQSTDCELLDAKSFLISKCSVREYVRAFSNVWPRPALCVDSKTELALKEKLESPLTLKGKDLKSAVEELQKLHSGALEESTVIAIIPQKEETKYIKIADALKTNEDGLKTQNLANIKSSKAFYRALSSFKAASSEDITKALKSRKFKHLKNQILDLVAAASTESSLNAAFQFFDPVTDYNEDLERFLISLSIRPKHQDFVIKLLKNFIDAKKRGAKLEATLISTLGAILKTYSQTHMINKAEIINDMRSYLEQKLEQCESDECRMMYLRGLRNAALHESVPAFFRLAKMGGKVALESLLALRNVPERLWPQETDSELLRVFLQVGGKQDSSTRAVAVEMLLQRHPGPDVIKGILHSLSDQKDVELATFLASKLLHMMSMDDKLRSAVMKLLPEKHISYYYSLSQKGASSIFSKPLITAQDINGTYGLQMEMLGAGLLKRSVFDVDLRHGRDISNFISVGIFAEGLESLAGGDILSGFGGGDEGSGPTAGIEISLLGSTLRPYVFFQSASELMGHAWSGTASEPTPILQGIYLFSDDERLAFLNNGMPVRVQLRSVLSVDASGSIQVSLWNRNSQALVRNAGALFVRGAVTVDSGFAVDRGTIQFEGESAIDFKTDSEFSDTPFKICFQMEHPHIQIKFDLHRSVDIPGTDFHLRRSKRRRRQIPSRSFALTRSNNNLCRIMNSS